MPSVKLTLGRLPAVRELLELRLLPVEFNIPTTQLLRRVLRRKLLENRPPPDRAAGRQPSAAAPATARLGVVVGVAPPFSLATDGSLCDVLPRRQMCTRPTRRLTPATAESTPTMMTLLFISPVSPPSSSGTTEPASVLLGDGVVLVGSAITAAETKQAAAGHRSERGMAIAKPILSDAL